MSAATVAISPLAGVFNGVLKLVIAYYLASYLDFLGLQYISAALERLILFAYPTLVVVLSALFLGKRITRRAMGSIALCYAGIALAVAHDDHLSHRRECGSDGRQAIDTIERLAAVGVAVGGEQEHGLDLPETVNDAVDAEVGRRRTEHRPDRCRREHDHHRLGNVGHPRRHPVTRLHTSCTHGTREVDDRATNLCPRDGAPLAGALVHADVHPGLLVGTPTVEDHFGDVESGVGEEPRLGHRGAEAEHHGRTDGVCLYPPHGRAPPGGFPVPIG